MKKSPTTSKKGHSDIKGIINTLTEQLNSIEDDEVLLYRGQSNFNWELIPSIKRNGYEKKENLFVKEIISSYPNEFKDDKTTLEYLIRSQHYELPTRLLDLTFNPLIALYFCLDRVEDTGEDGKILFNEDGSTKLANGKLSIFKIKKNAIKYYDSDTASCIANLAFLTYDEKESIKEYYSRYETNKNQAEFLKEKSIIRLLHFIKLEKTHFDDNINPEHLFSSVVVKGKMNNNRIIAQQGLFLLTGLNDDILHGSGLEHILDIKIVSDAKIGLKNYLNKIMSINNSTIYPEIIQHSKYIKEMF